MAAGQRSNSYVWVTWITKYLSQHNQCYWSAWFKAHHFYDKTPFDNDEWIKVHDALVKEEANDLARRGYRVFVENENSFKLTGNNGATLAGKPDIVAVNGDHVLVTDCKVGDQHPSHRYQVMIYMLCLPRSNPSYGGLPLEGRLRYNDSYVDIPAWSIGDDFKSRFREIMHLVGGVTPPDKVPSPSECGFCNIGKIYCSERIEPAPDTAYPAHDLF